MPTLSFVARITLATDAALSRITDLDIRDTGAGAVLYATTRYDGAITAWGMGGGGLTRIDTASWGRPDQAGAVPGLTFLDTGSGQALLAGGGVSGALILRGVEANGGLADARSLGTIAAIPGDLVAPVTVVLGNGNQMVFGGIAGAHGIARLGFSPTGTLLSTGRTGDSTSTFADRVSALASAVVGGQSYLFAAGSRDNGVTAYAISGGGWLNATDSLGATDGLWIAAPTALAVAEAGGAQFLVLAAAGSGSLSVMRIGAGGSLTLTDHVIDDLTTRFDGVTALTAVRHHGMSYLVAGGADDGVTVFQLIPGGRLLTVATLADTLSAGLTNISALTARSAGGRIEIYAASATETGITRLHLDLGLAGAVLSAPDAGGRVAGGSGRDVLAGGDGADSLGGGSGDDVICDGAGADTLTGGSGADVFVLAADGTTDRITDFTPGQDRLDLSGWAGLRSASQLTLTQTATGIRIIHGDEVLEVTSASGTPIAPAQLGQGDLVGQFRIDPALFAPPEATPPGADIFGTARADSLRGSAEGHRIWGQEGNDTLAGGAGVDRLYGGAGRDRLDGGGGANVLEGGLGDDRYIIRSTADLIRGEVGYAQGGGIDTVESWISLVLPGNVEVLRLQGTANLAGSGTAAWESLVGNAGHNTLNGGGGVDRLNGKDGHDRLTGGLGADTLSGEAGQDVFVLTALAESRPGQDARDFINTFLRGDDRIDLSLIDADPGRAGDQAFRFIGSSAFSGTDGEVRWFTFGGGNYNVVEIDQNGDRLADAQIFVNGTHWMTGSDFIL